MTSTQKLTIIIFNLYDGQEKNKENHTTLRLQHATG